MKKPATICNQWQEEMKKNNQLRREITQAPQLIQIL
jgi:hypothetical protein